MSTKATSQRRIALLIVFSMLLSLAGPLLPSSGQTILAAKAELKIKPDEAHSGDKVKAEGEDFPEESPAQLVWEIDQSLLAEFETDKDGEFEIEFTVPAAAAGSYDVKVVSARGPGRFGRRRERHDRNPRDRRANEHGCAAD